MPFGRGRKRGYEWEVDKNTVKYDHCEQKITNKMGRVRAYLEKCKTKKGKKNMNQNIMLEAQ